MSLYGPEPSGIRSSACSAFEEESRRKIDPVEITCAQGSLNAAGYMAHRLANELRHPAKGLSERQYDALGDEAVARIDEMIDFLRQARRKVRSEISP